MTPFPSGGDDLQEQLARGHTLPATWYAFLEIFRREQARIFRRSWQYAGHLAQLAQPGDYFTADVGVIPVVVLRDQEGTLRAFVNVFSAATGVTRWCEDRGSKKVLQCPYHAWTYGLDGSLQPAPRADRERHFDARAYPLFPLAVGTWGPLIFVNPDPTAQPLAEALGDLPARVASARHRPERAAALRHRQEYHLAANWKVFVENSIGVLPLPGRASGVQRADRRRSRIVSAHCRAAGTSSTGAGCGPGPDRTGPPDFQFSYFFPATMLSMPPGAASISP